MTPVIAPRRAIRVRTIDGWVDLANEGPPGLGYETTPVGAVIAWSRRTVPEGYVYADGGTYQAVDYPQAYEAAAEEVAAGSSLWTVDATQETFTVPDLRDRFLYASGSRAWAERAGSEAVALNEGELASHAHSGSTGWQSHDHAHTVNAHGHGNTEWSGNYMGAPWGGIQLIGLRSLSGHVPSVLSRWVYGETAVGNAAWMPYGASGDYFSNWENHQHGIPLESPGTGGVHTNHYHDFGTSVAGSGNAHNNMPPFVVLAFLIKVHGVAVTPDGAIQGPPGIPGNSITIPIEPWHIVGDPGEPQFQNGWSSYSSPHGPVAFRKYPDGKVKMRGLIQYGAAHSIAFTLPPGYRPSPVQWAGACASGEPNQYTRVDVLVDGGVQVLIGSVGGPLWVGLNNVEFDTGTVTEWATGPPGPPGPPGSSCGITPGRVRAAEVGETAGWTTGQDMRSDPWAPMRFLVTPTEDCWWDLDAKVLLRQHTADWAGVDIAIEIRPGDALNSKPNAAARFIHHGSITAQVSGFVSAHFALNAGTTYEAWVEYRPQGGIWTFWRHGEWTEFNNYGARPR
jgi:microcystin-dependent protein